MDRMIINQTYATREEMEKREKEICEEFIVLMIEHMPNTIGEKPIYGIESVTHFGRRVK